MVTQPQVRMLRRFSRDHSRKQVNDVAIQLIRGRSFRSAVRKTNNRR